MTLPFQLFVGSLFIQASPLPHAAGRPARGRGPWPQPIGWGPLPPVVNKWACFSSLVWGAEIHGGKKVFERLPPRPQRLKLSSPKSVVAVT